MSKSLFTVRKRKKSKHPYVIVGANKTSFNAMSLTHKDRAKKRLNFPLVHNPNGNDKEKAYLRKQVVTDFKFRFSKAFKNYNISDEDARNILIYLNNKNKKK